MGRYVGRMSKYKDEYRTERCEIDPRQAKGKRPTIRNSGEAAKAMICMIGDEQPGS